MHRNCRCFSSVQAQILVLSLCVVIASAEAQSPSPSPSPAPPTASSTGLVPLAPGSASAAKKAKPAHRRHRIRRRRHINHAQSAIQSPPSYPGRLGAKVGLSDGHHIWYATRHQLGAVFAPGGSDKSQPGTFQFLVHPDTLRKYLGQLATVLNRGPVNAHPAAIDTKEAEAGDQQAPAKIVPEQPGRSLIIPQAVETIQKAMESDPTTSHILLPIETIPAKVHADKFAGIDARVGYFVTRFNPGDVGRTETVRRAISIIDGTMVPPGGIFSINKTVGERTAKRGFGIGHVFIDGKMEKQVGGGMCQVATTLFNASMLADLKIVERHQHVRTIPYVEPGRDATVYWGSKDFKIQNNTDGPLYISYKTTRSHAIVALFGKGVPGRKVKLINHHRQLAERHFTGQFYRVVYDPNGKAHKDKTYYSDYVWTPALDYTR